MSDEALVGELAQQILTLDCDADSRDDLFGKVFSMLTAKGRVRETFLGALSEREDNFPTGLDFGGFRVALPHIDPEHVIEPGILVCRTERPVVFMAMDDHSRPLEVVLTIWPLIVDPAAQVPFLAAVLQALQEPGLYDRLVSAAEEDLPGIVQGFLPTA